MPHLTAAEQEWIAVTLACHGYRAYPNSLGTVTVMDPKFFNGHVVRYEEVTLGRFPELWKFLEDREE